MLRRLLLPLGLALCGIAQAGQQQPLLDLTVTPAWQGWSRPGRATELDIRLSTSAPTRARLELLAGQQTLSTELELQPGRVQRLHLPLGPTVGRATVVASVTTATTPAAPPLRHDIEMAQSESPLLGLALVGEAGLQLEGFHAVALAADDLPRNASAYASMDALILDATTLGALDQRQLGALLSHVAQCGRVVVLSTEAQVRRVLDGMAGCSGQALMMAPSLREARRQLEASLAARVPVAGADIGTLAQADQLGWQRVSLLVAFYFAAAALALIYLASRPLLLLLTPALATVAVLALLPVMPSAAELVVWSEGETGVPVARYQAWQRFPGRVRERSRVPIPPQLASAAQPCDARQAMQFDYDASRAQPSHAEFETRLFHQVWLCYAGSFPIARAIATQRQPDGVQQVRNAGTRAWPQGWLLLTGRAHDLPALGPGGSALVGTPTARPPRDGVIRTALARTPAGAAAALWELELAAVADAPLASQGWLLVGMPPP
ncbi:hypothetical protein [Paucibacter soli]|uniref:hypothetical protein n=1 Tax=Paucibacter soli TaxID=3133433 RepID=UPI003095BAAF